MNIQKGRLNNSTPETKKSFPSVLFPHEEETEHFQNETNDFNVEEDFNEKNDVTKLCLNADQYIFSDTSVSYGTSASPTQTSPPVPLSSTRPQLKSTSIPSSPSSPSESPTDSFFNKLSLYSLSPSSSATTSATPLTYNPSRSDNIINNDSNAEFIKENSQDNNLIFNQASNKECNDYEEINTNDIDNRESPKDKKDIIVANDEKGKDNELLLNTDKLENLNNEKVHQQSNITSPNSSSNLAINFTDMFGFPCSFSDYTSLNSLRHSLSKYNQQIDLAFVRYLKSIGGVENLKPAGQFKPTMDLKLLIRQGIPVAYRGITWMWISGASILKKQMEKLIQEKKNDEKLTLIDLKRSYTSLYNINFSNDYPIEILEQINKNPTVSEVLINSNSNCNNSSSNLSYNNQGLFSYYSLCLYYSSSGYVSEKILFEIEKDVERTFPDHSFFQPESEGVKSLRKVLRAFACHNPSIGYCQSLNFLTATFLLFLNEEDSFYLLIVTVEQILPQDYYTNNMTGLMIDQSVLILILKRCLPKIYNKLKEFGCNSDEISIDNANSIETNSDSFSPTTSPNSSPTKNSYFSSGQTLLSSSNLTSFNLKNKKLYKNKEKKKDNNRKNKQNDSKQVSNEQIPLPLITIQWFLCLFINTLRPQVVLRILDIFFNEGNKVLFKIAAALFKLHEEEILSVKDSAELFTLIRNMGKNILDADYLISTAYKSYHPPVQKLKKVIKEQSKMSSSSSSSFNNLECLNQSADENSTGIYSQISSKRIFPALKIFNLNQNNNIQQNNNNSPYFPLNSPQSPSLSVSSKTNINENINNHISPPILPSLSLSQSINPSNTQLSSPSPIVSPLNTSSPLPLNLPSLLIGSSQKQYFSPRLNKSSIHGGVPPSLTGMGVAHLGPMNPSNSLSLQPNSANSIGFQAVTSPNQNIVQDDDDKNTDDGICSFFLLSNKKKKKNVTDEALQDSSPFFTKYLNSGSFKSIMSNSLHYQHSANSFPMVPLNHNKNHFDNEFEKEDIDDEEEGDDYDDCDEDSVLNSNTVQFTLEKRREKQNNRYFNQQPTLNPLTEKIEDNTLKTLNGNKNENFFEIKPIVIDKATSNNLEKTVYTSSSSVTTTPVTSTPLPPLHPSYSSQYSNPDISSSSSINSSQYIPINSYDNSFRDGLIRKRSRDDDNYDDMEINPKKNYKINEENKFIDQIEDQDGLDVGCDPLMIFSKFNEWSQKLGLAVKHFNRKLTTVNNDKKNKDKDIEIDREKYEKINNVAHISPSSTSTSTSATMCITSSSTPQFSLTSSTLPPISLTHSNMQGSEPCSSFLSSTSSNRSSISTSSSQPSTLASKFWSSSNLFFKDQKKRKRKRKGILNNKTALSFSATLPSSSYSSSYIPSFNLSNQNSNEKAKKKKGELIRNKKIKIKNGDLSFYRYDIEHWRELVRPKVLERHQSLQPSNLIISSTNVVNTILPTDKEDNQEEHEGEEEVQEEFIVDDGYNEDDENCEELIDNKKEYTLIENNDSMSLNSPLSDEENFFEIVLTDNENENMVEV